MKNFLFLFLALTGLSCSQTSAGAQTKLDANAFEAMLAKDHSVQLIDVRTPGEYNSGHLEGARMINFNGADFTTEIGKLDKSKPVAVYCAVGGRSGAAAEQLTQMGYKVYDLTGGIRAWKAQGKKTVH